MIARARHLQEERLFDSYMAECQGDVPDPPVAEHLADCGACAARYAALAAFMDGLRRDGDADADAVFTPERLRAQHQQIARRLALVGRPARVISFPGRIVQRTIRASTSRTAPRWIAWTASSNDANAVIVLAGLAMNLEVHRPHPNYSEILFESGDIAGAYSNLNLVRARAGVPARAQQADRETYFTQLMQERRWELFWEPNLWYHYTRTGRAAKFLLNEYGLIMDTKWNKFPIPQADIDLNPNLIQNTGY